MDEKNLENMPLISIIFRVLIIEPIRAYIDTIIWLVTTFFLFMRTVLRSIRLTIIFFAFIFLINFVCVFSEELLLLTILFWETLKFLLYKLSKQNPKKILFQISKNKNSFHSISFNEDTLKMIHDILNISFLIEEEIIDGFNKA